MTRRLFGIILLAVIAPATGCERQSAPAGDAPGKPISVKTIIAQPRTMAWTAELTGEVVAAQSVTISATVEGPISFCPWREGDVIQRAGEELIRIDRPTYRTDVLAAQAAVAVAQAKLADLKAGARAEEIAQARETVGQLESCSAFAANDLKRIEKLVAGGAVPAETAERARVAAVECQSKLASAKQRLAMLEGGPTKTQIAVAQAAVYEAEARLAMAAARLAECTITAPFAGVVSRVEVRAGDMASPRAPLLEMFDPQSLVVRFAVPEWLAGRVRPGQAIHVRLDATPGKPIAAQVSRVYPQLDPRMRTRTLEAQATQQADWSPGMFARLQLVLESAENAVAVPAEAIADRSDGQGVAFIVNDQHAHRRPIRLGIEQDGWVQIISGIEPGQRVIVGGLGRIKDGMAVSVAASSPLPPTKPIALSAEPK
ncbi:MAG: efflux RND transporter periplasmic adaptor subunit [Phycisphaeraceae bacterium]